VSSSPLDSHGESERDASHSKQVACHDVLPDLPRDSDGNALRRLTAHGSDLSKEMVIDFAMDVPDQDSGLAFAAIAEPLGFETDVCQDSVTRRWTCYCSRTMIPSYDTIISVQRTLENLGRPCNAQPDGWGSFGNGEEERGL
jgi:hypothetical protein